MPARIAISFPLRIGGRRAEGLDSIFDFATLISVLVIAALAISVCVGMALEVFDDAVELFRSNPRGERGFPIAPLSHPNFPSELADEDKKRDSHAEECANDSHP